MKHTHSLALAMAGLLFSFTSHANTLNHVTIYQGKALIERSTPVTVGEQTISFDCLAQTLDTDSIQLSADPDVQIGEIVSELVSGDDIKTCQNFDDNTTQSLKDIDAKLSAMQTSLEFLKNLGRTQNLNLHNDIATSATQIAQQVENTERTITTLKEQKAQLEQALTSAKTPIHHAYRVKVRVASPKKTTLTLSYLVNRASWQPQYQAKLSTATGKLDIILQALVAQQTGEYWQNSKVTLSTAEPNRRTASNTPNAINLYLSSHLEELSYAAAAPMVIEADMASPRALKVATGASAEPLPSFTVSSSQLGDLITYSPTQTLSLTGDGKRTTLTLEQKSTTATLSNRINWNDELTAYWIAKAEPINHAWLPAEAMLYRDGSFVGKGYFDQSMLNKSGLSFGQNRQITVQNLSNDTQIGTTGLLGGKQTQTLDKAIKISNLSSKPASIEVVSGIPVAKDSQIAVKSTYTPTPQSEQWQDTKGVATWQFDLNPQANTQLSQNHVISHPKDSQLSGL